MLKIVDKESGEIEGHLDGDAMCIKTHNSDPNKSTLLVKMTDEELAEVNKKLRSGESLVLPVEPPENDLLSHLGKPKKPKKKKPSVFKNGWFYISLLLTLCLASVTVWHITFSSQLVGKEVEKITPIRVDGIALFQKSYHREVFGRAMPVHKTEIVSAADFLSSDDIPPEFLEAMKRPGSKTNRVNGGHIDWSRNISVPMLDDLKKNGN